MSAFSLVFPEHLGATIPLKSPSDYVAKLEARIAALEDCLQELAPFAACAKLDMTAHFQAENDEMARAKGYEFKRDTLYVDQRVFRKVTKLLRQKIVKE